MSKGQSEVTLGPDWSVVRITAIDDDKKVPFAVIGGELKKLPTHHIIPKNRFNEMNRQVRAIYNDYEERAKLARELKKQNWAFDLEKYGVIIEEDGCLSISFRHTKKDGTHERRWRTLQEIESAIRQQDHTIENYLNKKSGLENGSEISPEFSNLFKQLSVILPHIEMRRWLLIRAQEQMNLSISQAKKGLEKFLAAKGRGREKCHGLPKRLERMAIYLNNKWPSPYREIIDRVLPLIKEAKKSAANLNWDKTKFLLSNAKKILISSDETSGRQSQLTIISEINPIRILAEVDKYNLAGKVITMAKKYLPDQYLKYQSRFRLNTLLAVSQLIITGKIVSREEILKLCG
ncbi:MAG: hypothetical protein V1732_01325 [Patescibacteria group bacterium]